MHTDIPTMQELQSLMSMRATPSVSFYVETTAETQKIGAARTELGNLLKEAVTQLENAETPKRDIWPIEEQVHDLLDDDAFWAHQGHSLAIFVTTENLRSYRLPNHLRPMVQVSDRFHVKPLLRAATVNQHAFVLALEENAVHLVEVFADMPAQDIRVPQMPSDAASAVGKASVNSRSYSGRIGAGEGQKVLLRAYCRQIDAALRPVLAGRKEPLILAAAEPLLSIFRSVNSYVHLSRDVISGSPSGQTPGQLADAARPILDTLHKQDLEILHGLYATRENEGRATTQIAEAARAATHGAVETLMVDMDRVIPGTVDEVGEITFADGESAASYGVIDEIAARALAAGARILALRRDDIPQGAALAAILRYPV